MEQLYCGEPLRSMPVGFSGPQLTCMSRRVTTGVLALAFGRENDMLNFEDLFHSFASIGLLVGPSEIQGVFCGRLVMGEVLEDRELLEFVGEYVDREELEDIEDELIALYQQCRQQIKSQGFTFQLLLPDEEVSIGQRTQALANWCQGFLYGLGKGGLKQNAALSEEAIETLEDLSAISQLNFDDADNDDEMNFFELTEFVRVVVLVLFVEMDQSAPNDRPTLH